MGYHLQLSPVEAADSIAHTYQSKPSYDSVEKYAKLDRDRKQRTGFPEVVYAEGKSYAQMATILENMMRRPAELVMATRVNKIDALQLLRRPILQVRSGHYDKGKPVTRFPHIEFTLHVLSRILNITKQLAF